MNRLAYNLLLDREPDEVGRETFLRELGVSMTKQDMISLIRSSDEFAQHHAFRQLGPGHAQRCVCRLQQADFVDPDHEVEYTHAELSAKLEGAGFSIVRRHGLNYAGASLASGKFDIADTARHWGLFDEPEDCYILAYLCVPAS